eukprot:gnl/MRDRNA2_/MRDRNA2_237066_c0_seq1.p1 gnl/MRDRNA2_/MRDRNA2_237066_c0~~gnl/MRDRNA2_/MRDRNA2_237066_c0_seq1.p1  ORF type:complete len:104 (-),score=13.48 gnl/MRDRNA2_/MRDRNA2_237066_c0_seq1:344-655(-)
MVLAGALGQHINICNALDYANIVWAFASCGQSGALAISNTNLLASLGGTARQFISKFTEPNLVNLAWVLATVNQPDVLLFAALAQAVERHVENFSVQNLANTI